jgi:hypothetical protein
MPLLHFQARFARKTTEFLPVKTEKFGISRLLQTGM